MVGSVIIVPLVMLLGSSVMRNIDSGRNNLVGYRTAMSLSSPEAWLYANRECSRLWRRIAYHLLWISPAAMGAALALISNEDLNTEHSVVILASVLTAITAAQIAAMLWSIWRVEKELRRRFSKDGQRVSAGIGVSKPERPS